MNRRVGFLAGAEADVSQAVAWYEAQQSDLGNALLDEVDALLVRVAENSLQFPEICLGVRRGLLRRFPYGVYFLYAGKQVEVIAVLHLHRKPRAWQRRV